VDQAVIPLAVLRLEDLVEVIGHLLVRELREAT
jgi:hypothetical protein